MTQPRQGVHRGLGPALTLLLLALLSACSPASPPDPEASHTDLDPVVERLAAAVAYEQEDKAIPAFSIALVRDQEPLWTGGFGPARPGGPTASGETVYRVASISKLFTAVAVMQLVEQGRLDLDAPVADYVPDFRPDNPFGTPITLRHLLAHRAGLVREPPEGSYFDPDAPDLAAAVASLNRTRLVYAPGTRTKYSNAGVTVAGRAVEEVTGQPFATYVQEAILDPLGMRSSSFTPRPDLRERLATGYMWTYDGRTFEAPVFELGIGPAAGLYSTVADLGRFMQVLFAEGTAPGGRILQPESLAQLWAVPYADAGQREGFGLGFYVASFEGTRAVRHSGVMYGFASRFYALPDEQLGVAVVGTLDATNPVVDRLAEYALSLLRAARDGRALPAYPTTHALAPEQAQAVAGRYDGPYRLRLTERQGQLYWSGSTERLRLRTRGDTLVADDRLGYGAWLLPRGDTLVSEAGLFERVADPLPPPAPPHLSSLLGAYGWDHNTLYLLERGGRLYALIEWFFYYTLAELEPDVWTFPDYGLYAGEHLRVRRNAAGQVSAVLLSGLPFERRAVAPEEGNVFRITPERPLDALRAEAERATPPPSPEATRAPDLVELVRLDPTIQLDVRYATADNFMGMPFYREGRAFLQRPAAEALVRAHQALRAQGYGLVVYDAYRPWHVTKMFWDATPEALRDYVADPANGSRHNRGCAVDVGLYDLSTGQPVPMPSGYDEFTPRAHAAYPGGTAQERWHRALLRKALEDEGFSVYWAEWWHFDYRDWRAYPLLDEPFDALAQP